MSAGLIGFVAVSPSPSLQRRTYTTEDPGTLSTEPQAQAQAQGTTLSRRVRRRLSMRRELRTF
jgi:hypothetical protein